MRAITVYVSVAVACSGGDFDPKETFDHSRRCFSITTWELEGVPSNLVVGSRDVPKNKTEEGHPDKAVCPRCLSWGPEYEA